MTNNKRMEYTYENEISTSDEDFCQDTEYASSNKIDFQQRNCISRNKRKQKCVTRNAQLARENRLKKKLYLTKLENDVTLLKHENKRLEKVVGKQTRLITDLSKQLKYFKSIVANSSDISKLIRNVHQTTGMSVSSSLEKNLSLKNVCVPKPNQPIARKTAHPWDESDCYAGYPTPESNNLSGDETLSGDELINILDNLPLNFPLDIPEVQFTDDFVFESNGCAETLNEHNYTAMPPEENPDDVGVCLHVSKHRVSLEFCSSCSENAAQAWPN